MQFHLPYARQPPPATSVAGGSVSGYANGSISANDVSAVQVTTSTASSAGGGGVAVGVGLLGGRRLAVRVAPPAPALASSSPIHGTAALCADGGERHHAALAAAGRSSARYTTDTTASSLPAAVGDSSMGTSYGGGLVRISELRRQGVSAVESGLRLATSGARTTQRVTVTHAGVVEDTPAPRRTSTQRGRGSDSGRGGRRGTTRGRSRRSGGRSGSSSGSGSTATSVPLREDGHLCDYRWFMARGRRCLVYDGRTYKGSSAHRMWEAVKAVARQRGLAQPTTSQSATPTTRTGRNERRAPTTARTAAAHTKRTRATSTSTPTPTMTPAPHRASARARSAAESVLQAQHAAHRAAPALHNEVVCARAEASLNTARLPAQWRELAGSLGLLDDGETGGIAELAEEERRALRGIGEAPTPHVAPLQPYTASYAGPARAAYRSVSAAEEVIEVTDSSSSGSSSSATNTYTEDDEEGSDSSSLSTHSRGEKPYGKRDVSAALPQPGDTQWPQTSYFSDDASSGWSSSSSLPRDNEPERKRAKVESRQLGPGESGGGSPRVRDYHGVQVVEEDGWVYPVEVYASQKQQQQQQQPQGPVRVKTSLQETRRSSATSRRVPVPAFMLYPRGAEAKLALARASDTGVTVSDGTADALDHVPLAELYSQGGGAAFTGAVMRPAAPTSALLQPSRGAVSGGMAVVRQSGAVVPVRPVSSGVVAAPAPRANAAVLPGPDDGLEGFSGADLADMFVTGEEIGGFRFDA